MTRPLLALFVWASCSSGDDAPRPVPAPVVQPAPPAPPVDAATDGISEIAPYDPESGLHMDDDARRTVTTNDRSRAKHREKRPIDVILRSSPPGARVSVDGAPIGTTPSYWFGEADGREHEFTFVLPRHAMARYRFVPLTSGVVHARLEPVAEDRRDEELAPEIAPVLAPDAGIAPVRTPSPIQPPPTVLTPDAPLPPPDAPVVLETPVDAPGERAQPLPF